MKEVILRILQSAKEPIHGMSRRRGECIFHCTIGNAETLVQEERTGGQVVSLRIRQLSNPLPEVMGEDSYKTVTKLELSCAIDVSWVFSIMSTLPSLSIVRFGASCFEALFGDCQPSNPRRLTQCPSVKELMISFDQRRLLQEDYESPRFMLCIDEILEYATKYLVNLIKADLYVPFGVQLETFLKNNPILASRGEKELQLQVGMAKFQSYAYNTNTDKRRLPECRRDSGSSGGDTPTPTVQVEVVPNLIVRDPRPQAQLKRARSLASENSSEPDELDEILPPKIKPVCPRPPVLSLLSNDFTCAPIPSYTPAFYSPRHSSSPAGGDTKSTALNHEILRISSSNCDTIPLPPPLPLPVPVLPDFRQMYTRR